MLYKVGTLSNPWPYAGVMEPVDIWDLKSQGRKPVRVRLSPPAPQAPAGWAPAKEGIMDDKQNLKESVSDIEKFMTTQRIVYGLFALSFFVLPAAFAGLIVAYIVQKDAQGWLKTHYTYLIRTFWIMALYIFSGVLTMIIFIGPIVLFAAGLWFVARIVLGWVTMEKGMPIENPKSWWLGKA